MDDQSARGYLEKARAHLERVQVAWYEPTDWSDLCLYGFYCLEACVMAAASHFDMNVDRTHPAKRDAAEVLHDEHGLPDIIGLLETLNQARKAVAYGDVALPELDAEAVAAEIEHYVDAVERLLMEGEQHD